MLACEKEIGGYGHDKYVSKYSLMVLCRKQSNVLFLFELLTRKKKTMWMTGKVLHSVKTKQVWNKWMECNDDSSD